jgi:hypothetical protein
MLRIIYFNSHIVNMNRILPFVIYGAEDLTKTPTNYVEHIVLSSLPPVRDADGNGEDDCCGDAYISQWSDNHCGYIGFRNLGGTRWDGWKD